VVPYNVEVTPFVSGIVLAAGFGRRMGGDVPKLLLPLDGEPVLARTLRNALASRLDEVLLVVGDRHRDVLRSVASLLSHPKLRVVRNREPDRGRLSSVGEGLAHTREEADSALFLCGDHPMVGPALVDRLLDLHEGGGYPLSFPTLDGRKGHPTVWRRRLWPDLLALEGDEGTQELVGRLWDLAGKLPLDEGASQLDVDTTEDYARLLELTEREVTP
jgi:molybdenum cofactor cytidylyltransferase